MPEAKNSRVQDLLMLAKNHYEGGRAWVECARRIVSYHNDWLFGRISDRTVAEVVLSDLTPIVRPSLGDNRFAELLLELGDRPQVEGWVTREGGVYPALIYAMLVAAMRTSATDLGFAGCNTLPDPDPFLVLALQATDPNALLTAAA